MSRGADDRGAILTTWVNDVLRHRPDIPPVTDLCRRLRDGVTLVHVLHVLSGDTLHGIKAQPSNRPDILQNLYQCLDYLDDSGVDVRDVSIQDIADGNLRSCLSLVENIRAIFHANLTRLNDLVSTQSTNNVNDAGNRHAPKTNSEIRRILLTRRPHSAAQLSPSRRASSPGGNDQFNVENRLKTLIAPTEPSTNQGDRVMRPHSDMRYPWRSDVSTDTIAHIHPNHIQRSETLSLRDACNRMYRVGTPNVVARPPSQPFHASVQLPQSHVNGFTKSSQFQHRVCSGTDTYHDIVALTPNTKVTSNNGGCPQTQHETQIPNPYEGRKNSYEKLRIVKNQTDNPINNDTCDADSEDVNKNEISSSSGTNSVDQRRNTNVNGICAQTGRFYLPDKSNQDEWCSANIKNDGDLGYCEPSNIVVSHSNGRTNNYSDKTNGRSELQTQTTVLGSDAIPADQATYPSSYQPRFSPDTPPIDDSIFDVMLTDTVASSPTSESPIDINFLMKTHNQHTRNAKRNSSIDGEEESEISGHTRKPTSVPKLRLARSANQLETDDESIMLDIDNTILQLSPRSTATSHVDLSHVSQKLEHLETMYGEIMRVVERKKGSIQRNMRHSIASSDTNSVQRDRLQERIAKSHDIMSMQKRIQRIESHIVNLARGVAQLTSEMRSHNAALDDLVSLREEVQRVRLGATTSEELTRPSTSFHAVPTDEIYAWVQYLMEPSRVRKLTRFFGEDPPLVEMFLKKIGYGKYADNFSREQIGISELAYMSEDRLKSLGLPLGPRLTILQHLRYGDPDIHIV